jgi:hypothetical protein
MATMSFSGIDEIDKVLKGLPLQLTHKILAAAHADAAKPIIPIAQARVNRRTGRLQNSIGVEKIAMSKTTELGLVFVGPRRKRGYKGNHGHLVEFGHKIKRRKQSLFSKPSKRKSSNAKFVKPYPFMEPAFNNTKNIVQDDIKVSIGKKLVSFMKRTVKASGGTWTK